MGTGPDGFAVGTAGPYEKLDRLPRLGLVQGERQSSVTVFVGRIERNYLGFAVVGEFQGKRDAYDRAPPFCGLYHDKDSLVIAAIEPTSR